MLPPIRAHDCLAPKIVKPLYSRKVRQRKNEMKKLMLSLTVLLALVSQLFGAINVPSASQRSWPWYDDLLGYSRIWVRDGGCAVTCISDYFRWVGVNLDPGQVNALGKARGWFSGPSVYWSGFFGYIGRRATRLYWENVPADMALICSEINAGRPILLQTCIGQNSNNRHWVVGIAHNGGNDVLVCDPIYGDWVWHSQRFGSAPRWIYGAVAVR